MKHNEAVDYFFSHLANVNNGADLQRLVRWVIPYLKAAPDRPMGPVENVTMDMRITHGYQNEKSQVWSFCTPDISHQLCALSPIFEEASSSPHFCHHVSRGWLDPSKGPALPSKKVNSFLGAFAQEHDTARALLGSAQDIDTWWTVFMEHTGLWLRTAYNWENPTIGQLAFLENAHTTMKKYAPLMADYTGMAFRSAFGATIDWSPPRVNNRDDEYEDHPLTQLKRTPYWGAISCGQTILSLPCEKGELNYVLFKEHLSSNAFSTIVQNIRGTGTALCTLLEIDEISERLMNRHMRKEFTGSLPTIPLPDEMGTMEIVICRGMH